MHYVAMMTSTMTHTIKVCTFADDVIADFVNAASPKASPIAAGFEYAARLESTRRHVERARLAAEIIDDHIRTRYLPCCHVWLAVDCCSDGDRS